MKDEGINFRSAIDGSTSGPIATAWNVRGWPTVYVIDEKGVIQGKYLGFQKDKIDTLVEQLVSSVSK
jgi:hypothetical protein